MNIVIPLIYINNRLVLFEILTLVRELDKGTT